MQRRRQVEREFFHGASVELVWDTTQRVEEGKLQLGGRAGPTVHISNLCHEMAHLVEIDDARCGQPGWGLQLPKVFIYDRMCLNPETNQATRREVRVAAYQLNLMRHLGLRATPAGLVRAYTFLPDWCFVPGRDDKARLQWCANQVLKLSLKPKYGIVRFKREWWRKQRLLASTPRLPSRARHPSARD